MPIPDETISFAKASPSTPTSLSLIAVDGSQIYPDLHKASLFYVINIGYFILRFDKRKAEADSDPSIIYDEDALFSEGHLIPRSVIDARRTAAEMAALERLATSERTTALGTPVFALADGTLTLWIDEKAVPPTEREALQRKYFNSIDHLANEKIPVAGYVARPSTFPVLHLIDLALSSDPGAAADRSRSGRSPFPGIDDRMLFKSLLPAGHRSAIFEFASNLNDQYRAHPINQSIHFFYLNVGKRYPVIARVEIPHWTVQDPALVDLVHATLVEQSSVTLNDPYPYALIRADEEAFISGEETNYLEEQMSVAMIRSGLRVNRSEKLSHKGRARKH